MKTRTHCKNGHHLSPENILLLKNKYSVTFHCRQCAREAHERFWSERNIKVAHARIQKAVQSCAIHKMLAEVIAGKMAAGEFNPMKARAA